MKKLEVILTFGVDKEGKKQKKSFYGKTKKEAETKKDKWLEGYLKTPAGCIESDGHISFATWTKRWLEVYKKDTVRPYTYENTYKTRVDKYLIPYFGERPLVSIKAADIQEFFNRHQHLSLALLKTLKTILNGIFGAAIDNDLCYKNPASNVKLKSQYKQKEKKVLDLKQREKAMKWCIMNEHYDILLVLKVGLRRGELIGLRWEDIDFKNRIITINESISPPTKDGVIDYDVKSQSSRASIPVDDEMIACFNKIPRISKRVFNCESANTYAKQAKRVLQAMAEECNLPYLTLHELRHTVGTVMRESEVDIYSISKLLRHSNIDITSKVYVHNDLEVLRRAILQ